MGMLEMRDGKFYRDYFYFDTARVLRQLCLLPPLWINETIPGRISLWILAQLGRTIDAVAGFLSGGRSRRQQPQQAGQQT
jgi:hypothetical protein